MIYCVTGRDLSRIVAYPVVTLRYYYCPVNRQDEKR